MSKTLFRNLTRAVAAGLIGLSFMFVSVAPAQAATVNYGKCRTNIDQNVSVKSCWVSYNWWERTFWGHRDGYDQPVSIDLNIR